jgi:hypothetical protein
LNDSESCDATPLYDIQRRRSGLNGTVSYRPKTGHDLTLRGNRSLFRQEGLILRYEVAVELGPAAVGRAEEIRVESPIREAAAEDDAEAPFRTERPAVRRVATEGRAPAEVVVPRAKRTGEQSVRTIEGAERLDMLGDERFSSRASAVPARTVSSSDIGAI